MGDDGGLVVRIARLDEVRDLQQAVLRPHGPLPNDRPPPPGMLALGAFEDGLAIGAASIVEAPWPGPGHAARAHLAAAQHGCAGRSAGARRRTAGPGSCGGDGSGTGRGHALGGGARGGSAVLSARGLDGRGRRVVQARHRAAPLDPAASRVRRPMIELRTPAEIEQMRPAGRFVAEVLTTLRAETKVGTNLLALDRHAHDLIRAAGAESCYLDYHPSFGASPFGKVICTSINDAVLHGLPHDYTLRNGDLVSLDFAASVGGWVADSAVSFVVGTRARGGSAADRDHAAGARRRHRRRRRRAADRGHLRSDRARRAGRGLLGQHRVRRARGRAHDARGATRAQRRTRRARLPTAPGSGDRHRALAAGKHGPHPHGPRRLDLAQRRRLPGRPLRAHRRHHRGRSRSC